jgi:carbon-monoxide dehydrogenase large subunit
VRAVITVEDLDAAGIKNMPAAASKHRDGSPTPRPPQRPLATGRVRYVGEPIAMVVAGREIRPAAHTALVRRVAETDRSTGMTAGNLKQELLP